MVIMWQWVGIYFGAEILCECVCVLCGCVCVLSVRVCVLCVCVWGVYGGVFGSSVCVDEYISTTMLSYMC